MLKKIEITSNPQGTNILFSPALPDLKKWTGSFIKGEISIKGAHDLGKIEGVYSVTKEKDKVYIWIHFNKGYQKEKNTFFKESYFSKECKVFFMAKKVSFYIND